MGGEDNDSFSRPSKAAIACGTPGWLSWLGGGSKKDDKQGQSDTGGDGAGSLRAAASDVRDARTDEPHYHEEHAHEGRDTPDFYQSQGSDHVHNDDCGCDLHDPTSSYATGQGPLQMYQPLSFPATTGGGGGGGVSSQTKPNGKSQSLPGAAWTGSGSTDLFKDAD